MGRYNAKGMTGTLEDGAERWEGNGMPEPGANPARSAMATPITPPVSRIRG
ncbi:MAG: hypothetical protein NVS4B8_11530 [Herpetosiphon sp.]